ncbi:hypothetical protein [Tautonia plasticadhaerens]|uniref:Uncharacterized protein n=1 Tax=Tautonia plasticadhaerens TaxID=2527974 RepID=A0A518GZJ2_9BACT|nr:hypothetical protein [Tautonia plasticadhaerens]QDV34004.1 hypothetical protein ElP_18850 [Tautonia plasticadhaerens]
MNGTPLYALAITDAGRLLGYVGSRPDEYSAITPESARKFVADGDAWSWIAGWDGPSCPIRLELLGLVGRGGGR